MGGSGTHRMGGHANWGGGIRGAQRCCELPTQAQQMAMQQWAPRGTEQNAPAAGTEPDAAGETDRREQESRRL